MGISQVTKTGGSVDSVIPRFDVTRPLNGLVYPFLGLAMFAALFVISIGFGTGVIRPFISDLVGNLPVVGGAVQQGAGQSRFNLEVPG